MDGMGMVATTFVVRYVFLLLPRKLKPPEEWNNQLKEPESC